MAKKSCFIKISGRKVRIDKEDRNRILEKKWRITQGTTGRPRVVTSMRTKDGVRSLTLGKFLMNPSKGKQVYPRRFNEGLDYTKGNLVVCSVKERQRLLMKTRRSTSSRFRGVSFQKGSKKWRAGIEVNGVSMNLGEFKNEKSAALAYNKAAKKYFGEMAYQNSVDRKLFRTGRR